MEITAEFSGISLLLLMAIIYILSFGNLPILYQKTLCKNLNIEINEQSRVYVLILFLEELILIAYHSL